MKSQIRQTKAEIRDILQRHITPVSEELVSELCEYVEVCKHPKNSDGRTKTPAIRACFAIARKYPPKEIWDDVIEMLGDEPNKERLADCRREWVGRGYNPMSWKWLDWYFIGIPKNGNGAKSNAKPITSKNTGTNDGSDNQREQAISAAINRRIAEREAAHL